MNYRRALSVLLAATAATMLVTGSFGFTNVSAERGVSVNVVDGENAYVNVSACDRSNGNGGANPVWVLVTNQYSDSFTVDGIAGSEELNGPNSNKATIKSGEEKVFKGFGEGELTVTVSGGLDATVTTTVVDKSDCDWKKVDNEDDDNDDDDNDDDNDE